MSSFQDFNKTRSQYPWGRSPEELGADGVELQDRECYLFINTINEIKV